MLGALTKIVHDCKNFKVRINAAMALSVPQRRDSYGDTQQFLAVWNSLVLALKSTEAVNNLAEYRYRDNLVEQVGNRTTLSAWVFLKYLFCCWDLNTFQLTPFWFNSI